MKLIELLKNQKITIQLLWGEQVIEFASYVIEKDAAAIYVNPYFHNGSELTINVAPGKGVVCNLFADDPMTKQRISWKNVELTTVKKNDKILYCIKTNVFNNVSSNDDRRQHGRIVIHVNAQVFDGQSEEGVRIIIHDISDVGISFYAPLSFEPKSNQLVVKFTDYVDNKEFEVSVECSIARTTPRAGNLLVGCKIMGENKSYQLYAFMKRLWDKNKHQV